MRYADTEICSQYFHVHLASTYIWMLSAWRSFCPIQLMTFMLQLSPSVSRRQIPIHGKLQHPLKWLIWIRLSGAGKTFTTCAHRAHTWRLTTEIWPHTREVRQVGQRSHHNELCEHFYLTLTCDLMIWITYLFYCLFLKGQYTSKGNCTTVSYQLICIRC